MKAAEVPYTFGLVPGFGHGAWCWDYLRPQLRARGHDSVAVSLPIGDPTASFDDYAKAAYDQLKHENGLVLVGHSRAANVVARMTGLLAVEKIVYIAGSFEASTLTAFPEEPEDTLPPKYSKAYESALYETGNGLWAIKRGVAQQVLYNDAPGHLQEWAAVRLRPQRRSLDEPTLEKAPTVPQEYIVCENDKALNPAWQTAIAHKRLKIPTRHVYTDHSPFLSHPAYLARELVESLASTEDA